MKSHELFIKSQNVFLQILRCQVEKSEPKPDFLWYIGDTVVTNYVVQDQDTETHFAQLLSYEPRKDHSNQTLKCVVDFSRHLGLSDTFEDSLTLQFTEDLLANLPIIEDLDDENDSGSMTSIIIGILVAVLFLCGVVFFAFRKCQVNMV